MLFCGLGETVLNNLFAALILPYVSPTTFKKRERKRERERERERGNRHCV